MSYSFELGPIRPPSEAMSILIRVTRNCPWNKCSFCHTYKDEKYSKRELEDIKKDIASIHIIAQRIIDASNNIGSNGLINDIVIKRSIGMDITPEYYYRQVAFWLDCGMASAFLQDANSLILKTADLLEILQFIDEKFPSLERITTYSRAKTVSKKTVEELRDLRNAGLSRLHIGMETGSAKILDFVQKGVTPFELIKSGQNAIEAGFDLSEYYMPGLGGKELSRENAIESAKVLNEVNPTFIRIRSTFPIPGTPLYQSMADKKWTHLTEEEKLQEIRLFLEKLDDDLTSNILSDHMMNLLEEVSGELPQDKGKMIDVIDKFLSMSSEEKESFILGRRLGYFRYLTDFRYESRVEKLKEDLKKRYSSVDNAILDLMKNFI